MSATATNWMELTKTAAVPAWADSFYLKMARSSINGQADMGNIAQFDNLSVSFDCDSTTTEAPQTSSTVQVVTSTSNNNDCTDDNLSLIHI